MGEIGLDIECARSKDLGQFLGKTFIHYAIVVCDVAEAECPNLFPFAVRHLYWPIPDPAGVEGSPEERLDAFREARDEVSARIREWLETKPESLVRAS